MNNSAIDKIENELNKIFDNLSSRWVKVSFILSKLDLSFLVKDINKSEFVFIIESMLKLYLWRRIKGITQYTKLTKELTDSESLELGFTKDDKDVINIPKKRTFNYFLQTKISKETRELLDLIAQRVISLSTKKGIILDLEIVKKGFC